MATSLSQEEFQQMQAQLLDLRSKNYTLGDENVKIKYELLQNNKLFDEHRKELAKCQKIISRTKNAKEIEYLMQENDALQHKLQMQEDEFRLQNETLMQEISVLVSSNEEMKKSVELLKTSSSNSEIQSDVLKLKAENSALRKLLNNYENKQSSEDSDGKENDSSNISLRLETVLEEKRLLCDSMSKLESEFREQVLKLQNENEKLSEKLKKKQESFLKLQEEKEQLYSNSQKAIENLEVSKSSEIQQLKQQIINMQSDLRNTLNFSASNNENIDKGTVEIDGEKATFECSFNETKMSLINIQEKMQQLSKQLENSEEKVRYLEERNQNFTTKISELEQQNNELKESLTEKIALAEKRKKMMDEMNNHLLETTNKHSREIDNLTHKLAEEQEALQKIYDKEKETELKLAESKSEIQTLKDEIERLRVARGDINTKLKEAANHLENTVAEYEDKLSKQRIEYEESLKLLKEEMESKTHDLDIQLEMANVKIEEYEDKIKSLQQAAKDSVDDRKIQEKKGVAMVKDLKRQLQVEKNRAEKLQERLQEILSEQNRPIDEILQSSNIEKPKGDASSISSWSYVSGGTADKEQRENIPSDTSSGDYESPNRISPTVLENETNNLLAKITLLQQKNWTLEEKVNHLEMSNEALVDDVLKKTALIQFYCMEGRSDPHASVSQDKLTIKRIVDFIKDRGDENLKEINRRMQRMLEETLTKNMHLQKDIETLSNEVSRLSKIIDGSPVENGIQSAVFIDGV